MHAKEEYAKSCAFYLMENEGVMEQAQSLKNQGTVHQAPWPSTSAASVNERGSSPEAMPLPKPKPVDSNHFPSVLYKMLDEIEKGQGAAAPTVAGEDFASIVSWQPHGKCMHIHDEKNFCDVILPKYFCRLKYTSFQRQLHFHGFRRVCKQGPDKGAYYHELFHRGYPEIATHIERAKSVKGRPGRKKKSHSSEPNFYQQPRSIRMIHEALAKTQQAVTNNPDTSSTATLPDTMVGMEPTPLKEQTTLEDMLASHQAQKKPNSENSASIPTTEHAKQSRDQAFLQSAYEFHNEQSSGNDTNGLLPFSGQAAHFEARRLSVADDFWGGFTNLVGESDPVNVFRISNTQVPPQQDSYARQMEGNVIHPLTQQQQQNSHNQQHEDRQGNVSLQLQQDQLALQQLQIQQLQEQLDRQSSHVQVPHQGNDIYQRNEGHAQESQQGSYQQQPLPTNFSILVSRNRRRQDHSRHERKQI